MADDRPIRASGQYNFNEFDMTGQGEETVMGETINTMEITNLPKKMKGFTKKTEPKLEELKTEKFYDAKLGENALGEYTDEFEDISSTEDIDDAYYENEPGIRLTEKQGQEEKSAVLNEYQKYIMTSGNFNMANSSHFSELSSKERVTKLSKRLATSQGPLPASPWSPDL